MSRVPAAFRLPAFASRSSDSRRGVGPSLRSAYRTRRRARPDLDGVPAFRTHELRPGWLPSLPRGRRCSSRPEGVPGRRLPLPSGQSLDPRHQQSVGEARLTRHQQGFKQFSRPVFPSPGIPGQNRDRLGLSPELRTPPTKSRRRTPRRGQAIEHGPGTTRSTSHQSILQSCVHSLRATSRRTASSSRPRSVVPVNEVCLSACSWALMGFASAAALIFEYTPP